MASEYEVKKGPRGKYTVSYDCPHCSAGLESPLDDAGKPDVCPKCQVQFVVPGAKDRDNVKSKCGDDVRQQSFQDTHDVCSRDPAEIRKMAVYPIPRGTQALPGDLGWECSTV